MTNRVVSARDLEAVLATGEFTHLDGVKSYLLEILDLRTGRTVEEESEEWITTVHASHVNEPDERSHPNQTVTLTQRRIVFRQSGRDRTRDRFLEEQTWLAENCTTLVGYLEALHHVGALRIAEVVYYRTRSVPYPGVAKPVALAGVPLLKVKIEPGNITLVLQMDCGNSHTLWQDQSDGTRRTVRAATRSKVVKCLADWCHFEIV